MNEEKNHNKQVILFVAFVVSMCVSAYTYLSMHGKPEAAILTIATYAMGLLTGSQLNRPKTGTEVKTDADSTTVSTSSNP